MKPFANESDSIEIGNLTVENRTDRISIYGDFTITRDEAGLANVRALQALLNDTEEILVAQRAAGKLPKAISFTEPVEVVNPFLKKQ